MHRLMQASLVLALAAPFGAMADAASDSAPDTASDISSDAASGIAPGSSSHPPSSIEPLRREIEAMRADYEARLRSLEQRLKAAEARAAQTHPMQTQASPAQPAQTQPAQTQPASTQTASTSGAQATAPAPAPASASALRTADATTVSTAAAPGGAAPQPSPSSAGASPNAFNPAISLILSGTYTRTSQDPSKYAITGIPLPADAGLGPGPRGLSLAESELGISANIDPWLRGAAFVAFEPDNTVSIEEAWIQTTALGSGFSLKAGRFFSGIGYLNSKHAHTWDFVDNPLAYQAFLGRQFGDDGLQLTWVAPTELLVELGAEIGRGRSFPGGGDTSRNGAGMRAISAHVGGDIGDSHSWRAGLSMLQVKALDQDLLASDPHGDTVESAFSGNTRVWIADAVWKWAPNGNATRTSFTLQGEYLRSIRNGDLVYDVGGADSAGAFRSVQSGAYLQGVYQFMPRWRLGLRTERLDPGSPEFAADAAALAGTGYRPRKNTLMIDFNPSEFSRVRLQLARDASRQGFVDNQIFLQYQMSLGAHGAHGY